MEFNLKEPQIIILIVVALILFFALLGIPMLVGSLNYFGFIDIPFLPKGQTQKQVLIIGDASLGERVVLDNLSASFTYRTRAADSFGASAFDELQQYDLIILDQSTSSTKSISVTLGEAIQKYVAKGGKLIVVLNSGIYQDLGFNVVAKDVVGWKATLGDIVPADCVLSSDGSPSCVDSKELTIVGRINKQDFEHPIMEGVEVAPPMGQPPISLMVLPVQANTGAKTIAYVKSETTPASYPAILEKKSFPMGTVIYFNYDPGMTPGIFTNTLNYLK